MLSNIKPCNGRFLSPLGGGIISTILSTNSLIPTPVFALVNTISSSLKPIKSISSFFTFVISALGKSILLITGIIVKLFSSAKYKLARVCASIPCVASTTKIAPSHDARLRDTS